MLGLSAHFHDSSAALIVDGRIVAAVAEERFTRTKHDSNFPHFAIKFCLEQVGLDPQDLDVVVFYEEPHTKFTRVLASTMDNLFSNRAHFVAAMKQWTTSRLWTRNEISVTLDIDPKKVRLAQHHESHAAQAFAEAAIVTVDAVGEWTCTSIGEGNSQNGRTVTLRESIPYPHSLGLVYAVFTAFLGFRPNDSEASTMALAAFGQPRYADRVRQVIQLEEDGLYTVNHRTMKFLAQGSELFTPVFLEMFGEPRRFRNTLPFDAIDDDYASRVTEDDQRFADIAASVQQVCEEAVLGLARRARRLTGHENLCVAGGVALNAVANTRLIEHSGFNHVFVSPDPGDGGAALGSQAHS